MEKKFALDRRSFLTATAASAAAISLTGCAPESKITKDQTTENAWNIDTELTSPEGKWVPIRCQIGCGGECGGKMFVEDGILVRSKSDDEGEDTIERPQRRRCPRGRAARQTVMGADRIKFPMKRKHWEPLTGGDKSLRGKDEWERISWDEALDNVATELQNAISKYGNKAILCNGPVYEWGQLLNSVGDCGCTSYRDTLSHGSAYFAAWALGAPSANLTEVNGREDLANAETVVLYGMNPVWASAGNQTWFAYTQAKENGAQFIYVGPSCNVTASLFEAKWIRVRPGTDTAFLLAVAYEMFELDAVQGNFIDWDFLDKYTVGIDGDHMPADAKVNENFKDYLYGVYDGQVKNAEWASEISGTPTEDIRWYATEMRKDKAVSAYHSFAPARVLDSENWLRLFMTVGYMGGHLGKPGHSTGAAYHASAWRADARHFTSATGAGGFETISKYTDNVNQKIQATELWQSIIDRKYTENGQAYPGAWAAPESRDLDIHVILEAKTNTLNSKPGTLKAMEALRTVDFVCTCSWFLTGNASHSDIILPIATNYETKTLSGTYGQGMYRDFEAIYLEASPLPTLYEARDIREVMTDIGKRMGVDNIWPEKDRDHYVFNGIAGITWNKSSDKSVNLVSVTEEDIKRWGVEGKPQEGHIPLSQLEEEGIFKLTSDSENCYMAFADYFADPKANPRPTPSGKFEIYSQSFADAMKLMKFDDFDWKPYPAYKAPTNGYGSEAQQAYRFQMYTPHYLRRNHTLYDNNPYLREAFEQPVYINQQDAQELGIQMGDTVLLSNQFGKVIRRASVINSIMPGVTALPHGAWVDYDEKMGVDKAGCSNVLTPQMTSGSGTNGYNSTLINIEKWTGDPLDRDCDMPPRMIEA